MCLARGRAGPTRAPGSPRVGPARARDGHVLRGREGDADVAVLAAGSEERHDKIVPDAHLVAGPQVEDEVPDGLAHAPGDRPCRSELDLDRVPRRPPSWALTRVMSRPAPKIVGSTWGATTARGPVWTDTRALASRAARSSPAGGLLVRLLNRAAPRRGAHPRAGHDPHARICARTRTCVRARRQRRTRSSQHRLACGSASLHRRSVVAISRPMTEDSGTASPPRLASLLTPPLTRSTVRGRADAGVSFPRTSGAGPPQASPR